MTWSAFTKISGSESLAFTRLSGSITRKENVEIIPITNIAHVQLSDLVGYEIAKKKLIDNTEAFVSGKKANNCLLLEMQGPANLRVSKES